VARRRNTDRLGRDFSPLVIATVWSKGKIIPGDDPTVRRRDSRGAPIRFDKFGNTTDDEGWEIDHIVPVKRAGGDNVGNLQPLQWENNERKGNGWPD